MKFKWKDELTEKKKKKHFHFEKMFTLLFFFTIQSIQVHKDTFGGAEKLFYVGEGAI